MVGSMTQTDVLGAEQQTAQRLVPPQHAAQ